MWLSLLMHAWTRWWFSPWVKIFSVSKLRHLLKNIRSWVKIECCCFSRTVDILNANFTNIFWQSLYSKKGGQQMPGPCARMVEHSACLKFSGINTSSNSTWSFIIWVNNISLLINRKLLYFSGPNCFEQLRGISIRPSRTVKIPDNLTRQRMSRALFCMAQCEESVTCVGFDLVDMGNRRAKCFMAELGTIRNPGFDLYVRRC